MGEPLTPSAVVLALPAMLMTPDSHNVLLQPRSWPIQRRTLALELVRIARSLAKMVWHAVVLSMVLVSHSARLTLTTRVALEPLTPSAVVLALPAMSMTLDSHNVLLQPRSWPIQRRTLALELVRI